jgi:hypothetical protein
VLEEALMPVAAWMVDPQALIARLICDATVDVVGVPVPTPKVPPVELEQAYEPALPLDVLVQLKTAVGEGLLKDPDSSMVLLIVRDDPLPAVAWMSAAAGQALIAATRFEAKVEKVVLSWYATAYGELAPQVFEPLAPVTVLLHPKIWV